MAPAKKQEFDTTKWLTDDLGFTAAEAAELSAKFAPRADKIREGYLRQADYSRNVAEVRKLQEQFTAKDNQLNAEMAEWAKMQGQDDQAAATLRTELERTRVEKFQIEERLRTLATEHGVDPETVLPKGATVDPNAKPIVPPAPFDDSKYVNREQFGAVTDYLLTVPAELAAIAQEHFALTGEHLDTRPLITELKARVAKKQPADLRTIWEDKNGIGEKRTTKAKEAHDKEIADAEARGREAARSESQLPNQHPTGHQAPIFTSLHGESKVARPQPGVNTRNFADSLRSRKYAGGVPANTGPGSK